jgi:hypothetical protein
LGDRGVFPERVAEEIIWKHWLHKGAPEGTSCQTVFWIMVLIKLVLAGMAHHIVTPLLLTLAVVRCPKKQGPLRALLVVVFRVVEGVVGFKCW